MNEKDVAEVCGVLSAALNWRPTADTLSVWAVLLEDIPRVAGLRAAAKVASSATRWPTVSDIRRAVAEDAGLLPPPLEVAWTQALRRDRDAHPSVIAARDATGDEWRWRTEAETWLRRDFAEHYRSIGERQTTAMLGDRGVLGAGVAVNELGAG